jgi:pilus assembly protein CpaD
MSSPYPIAALGVKASAARALCVVFFSIALAGCYTAREAEIANSNDDRQTPNDYRQRHPIVVQERAQTTELFIGSWRGELLPAQRATVLAFARGWSREATGGVVIEVPSGASNARTAQTAVRNVRSILVAAGVPARDIHMKTYRADNPGQYAAVRLHYPRVAADAGPCGLWPHDIGPSSYKDFVNNKPYWNLGCAVQRNLAAMVDNPEDLVQPRGETPASTPQRSVMMEKYRKGESTASTSAGDGKGKISDIGK